VALVPLNVTAVAPVRFVPVTTTVAPTAPDVGVNDPSVGAASTVKLATLVDVPPGVVTETGPVVAPAGTVAVIWALESTVNDVAVTPLNLTALAPVRLVPVITTVAPTAPLAGRKEATVGAATTVKLEALVAVPPGVVTEIVPVVAPAGTVAVTCVAESTVNDVAATPLNLTAVAPVRFVPVITTVAPTAPEVGVNEVTLGAGIIVNEPALVPVPPGVVMAIGPVVAAAGTVAVTCVAESTVYTVVPTPLKLTAVAPVRFVPVMTTVVPAPPLVGVNEVTVGAGRTVKLAALVPVPAGAVTEIGPVVAPAGTVAVIWVFELTVNAIAETPLNLTAVAPVRFVPVTTTDVPMPPLAGAKEVTVGGRKKFVALVPVPPAAVTEIGPVVAPAGTVAVIFVALLTVTVVAVAPPNLTAVTLENPVPLMTTPDVPTLPLVGEKDVIVGAAMTVKLELVAVPPGVVTVTNPLVAPAGTVAVIWVLEPMVNAATTPLNRTTVAPTKFVPAIVTELPTAPVDGVREVIVGTRLKLK
jgi:hypothetical protein